MVETLACELDFHHYENDMVYLMKIYTKTRSMASYLKGK